MRSQRPHPREKRKQPAERTPALGGPRPLRVVTCSLCAGQWPWEATELPQQAAVIFRRRRGLVPGRIMWACPDCITAGVAERADPSRQSFGGLGSPPYLSYWDQTRSCQYCAAEYVFTIGEQRFWFETLRAHVQTNPVGCRACRRRVLEAKRAQQSLMEKLPRLDKSDWAALAELGDLSVKVGSARRALEFFRRARKRCPDPTVVAELESTIGHLEQEGVPKVPRRKYWQVSQQLEQIERLYEPGHASVCIYD